MRSISKTTITIMFTESTGAANTKNVVNSLVNSKNFSIGTIVEDTDDKYDVYLTPSDNSYYSLRVYTYSNGDSHYLGLGAYSKGSDGSWVLCYTLTSTHMPMYDSTHGVRIRYRSVDTDFIYTTITSLKDSGATTVCTAGFSSCSYVDYFTGVQKKGLLVLSPSSSSTHFYVCDANNIARSGQEVIIGGSIYPSRNQSVAAPLMVTSSTGDFYGYVVDSTFFYTIFVGSSMLSTALDTKVAIDGHTFVHLVGNYYVRID